MTPVIFHFVSPTGIPIANAPVEIQLSRSAFDIETSGITMPRLVTATTDEDGKCTVELWSSDALYFVAVFDTEGDAGLSYKFLVPESEGNAPVRLQDIVIVGDLPAKPYDEAALLVIHAAKAATLGAQAAATSSAALAMTAQGAAAASALSANASKLMALRTLTHQGPTPPEDPLANTEWLNTTNGKRYLYLVDADGSQWVEAGSISFSDDPVAVLAAEAARDLAAASVVAAAAERATAVTAAALATTKADEASEFRDEAGVFAGQADAQRAAAQVIADAAQASADAAEGFAGDAEAAVAQTVLLDADMVHKAGAEAIAGVKTFSDKPVFSAGATGVTKADVGLGNAENKSSATIRGELTGGNVTGALGFTPVNPAAIGAADGVAPLGADSKIPAVYLPAYVDDVLEAANFAALPVTGTAGKIYTTLDNNKVWRWGGSAYIEISPSPGSTDAVPEGASNQYFNFVRVRTTTLTGIDLVTNAVVTAADTVMGALGKLHARLTGHMADVANPHAVTQAQVGLGNVDNTSDANKPVSTAVTTALALKANKNIPLIHVMHTTVQAMVANVASRLLFQTEPSDVSGFHDPALGRFLPNVAGWYAVVGGLQLASPGAMQLFMYKNGGFIGYLAHAASTSTVIALGNGLVFLNGTTDFLELWGQTTVNVNTSTAGNTFFQAYLVKAT